MLALLARLGVLGKGSGEPLVDKLAYNYLIGRKVNLLPGLVEDAGDLVGLGADPTLCLLQVQRAPRLTISFLPMIATRSVGGAGG